MRGIMVKLVNWKIDNNWYYKRLLRILGIFKVLFCNGYWIFLKFCDLLLGFIEMLVLNEYNLDCMGKEYKIDKFY